MRFLVLLAFGAILISCGSRTSQPLPIVLKQAAEQPGQIVQTSDGPMKLVRLMHDGGTWALATPSTEDGMPDERGRTLDSNEARAVLTRLQGCKIVAGAPIITIRGKDLAGLYTRVLCNITG